VLGVRATVVLGVGATVVLAMVPVGEPGPQGMVALHRGPATAGEEPEPPVEMGGDLPG
jgi:hypothetical protein